jgi:hypothetical protein
MSITTPLFPTAATTSDLFVNPRTATTSTTAPTTTNNNNYPSSGWGGYGGQSSYFQTVVISLVALAVLLIISVVSILSIPNIHLNTYAYRSLHKRCSCTTVVDDYATIKEVKNGHSQHYQPMDEPADEERRKRTLAKRLKCTNACWTFNPVSVQRSF